MSSPLSCCVNGTKPLADIGLNTSSKGRPRILLTKVSENPSHKPSIPPCPQKLGALTLHSSSVIVITALQREIKKHKFY